MRRDEERWGLANSSSQPSFVGLSVCNFEHVHTSVRSSLITRRRKARERSDTHSAHNFPFYQTKNHPSRLQPTAIVVYEPLSDNVRF